MLDRLKAWLHRLTMNLVADQTWPNVGPRVQILIDGDLNLEVSVDPWLARGHVRVQLFGNGEFHLSAQPETDAFVIRAVALAVRSPKSEARPALTDAAYRLANLNCGLAQYRQTLPSARGTCIVRVPNGLAYAVA